MLIGDPWKLIWEISCEYLSVKKIKNIWKKKSGQDLMIKGYSGFVLN